MESVAGGRTAIAVLRTPAGSSVAQKNVCDGLCWVITHKSRTVWFPVLHGRGFL
jgi:hypothetical protein